MAYRRKVFSLFRTLANVSLSLRYAGEATFRRGLPLPPHNESVDTNYSITHRVHPWWRFSPQATGRSRIWSWELWLHWTRPSAPQSGATLTCWPVKVRNQALHLNVLQMSHSSSHHLPLMALHPMFSLHSSPHSFLLLIWRLALSSAPPLPPPHPHAPTPSFTLEQRPLKPYTVFQK